VIKREKSHDEYKQAKGDAVCHDVPFSAAVGNEKGRADGPPQI
jgi:hypothetical protein